MLRQNAARDDSFCRIAISSEARSGLEEVEVEVELEADVLNHG